METLLFITTKVINLIDFDVERLHDIVVDELKVFVRQPVLHVPLSSSKEVVDDDYLVALDHQLVDEMRSDESCAASDEDPLSLSFR